ncbi:MAG: PD-(D/E)XK nuclease family protein [Longimicrobiales bacterium]
MPATQPSASSRLVESLARASAKSHLARKLLVARTVATGRELLRRLALSGHGWIGFEVITPRPLALRLARPAMEVADMGVLDAFEQRAILDEVMDYAVSRVGARFGALSDGVGFRERVHGAIDALRLADVGVREIERARGIEPEKRRLLGQMLQRYQETLAARRRADTAEILRLGLAALDAEGARLPPSLDFEVVLLVPGLGTRGLTGRLLAALGTRGAKVLETDPALGIEVPRRLLWKGAKQPGARSYLHAPDELGDLQPPATDVFRASSVHEELREVLRRVASRGLRWDQVEIVTPDPAVYGSALQALASELHIPVTFAVGLPIERTRTGRAVRAYLEWIEEGFHADPVRRLLEAGDLRPRDPEHRHHSGAALARRFRTLRIGWGRQRYRTQIKDALAGLESLTPGKYDGAEGFARRRDRARSELEALRSILFPTLRATPSVPDHMGLAGARVSPSELARGLRAFLRRVPRGAGVDRSAREEVDRVVDRVEATLVRRTSFGSAVTVLRRHLEVRVRGEATRGEVGSEGAPWGSEGGHLHLTDLEHGGFTGREAVFLVGMDVERTLGSSGQDPVLLDGDRRVLGGELPTSTEMLRERAFDFAALYARLHGSVTLSYAAWDASEARAVGPSPILVQALRLSRADPSLTFKDLETASGRVVSAAPSAGRLALDRDDAWMAQIATGGVLRTGAEHVASNYPSMLAGIAARAARAGAPGPYHGVVAGRPALLDPRLNPSLVVSAGRLQDLGACPLRYLHRAVLGVHPPDDPEFDPGRWLDPLRAGTLLHEVYEGTLREAKARGVPATDPAFEGIAMVHLDGAVARMRATVPVPGEGALQREAASLRGDVRSFIRMIRQRGASWIELEMRFGLGDDEPVTLDLTGGGLRLRGAIDRVDEDLQGLTVIDYKTGGLWDSERKGAFHGGRRLQHALYALVAEARLKGMVVKGEYHYPTTRGQNQVLSFDRLSIASVQGLLEIMLDSVASGVFVPTDDSKDCRFCDFASVCRVQEAGYRKLESPLAEWSLEYMNSGWPALTQLKRVRAFES